MRTITRLALGAGAVSAATVLGTALPASASSHPSGTHPIGPESAGRPGAAATTSAATSRAAKPSAKRSGVHSARTAHARPATKPRSHAAAAPHTTAKHVRTGTGARTTAHGTRHLHRTAAKPTRTATTTWSARRAPTSVAGRTSDNWSGYTQSASQLGHPVTSVSGSWAVPRATQRVRGESEVAADWVGVGGTRSGSSAGDPTLLQAGETAVVGRSGYTSYFTWFEALPSQAVTTPLTVQPGDHLSVDIGRVSTDRWRVRMANATTGHTWATSVRYHSSSNSADWISERPSLSATQLAPLPNRTATSFRNARVNGARTNFHPSQRITMTSNGRSISTPSGPESWGSGFSVCSYSTHCGAHSR